ncbi:MAG: hypothetical protein FVQ82_11070 [Planctomycetes bacterium]|nr:hypothetical protein [Planctomycetota bacterium]
MKANTIHIVLGILLFIIAITGAILCGSDYQLFICFPSIIFVVVVGGSLGLASYRSGGFVGYIKACKKHFIAAVILATVIEITKMLYGLSYDSLGAAIAIFLMPLFYGIILYCIADAISA